MVLGSVQRKLSGSNNSPKIVTSTSYTLLEKKEDGVGVEVEDGVGWIVFICEMLGGCLFFF